MTGVPGVPGVPGAVAAGSKSGGSGARASRRLPRPLVRWLVIAIGFGLAGGLAHGTAGMVLWIALAFLAIGGAADMVSSAFRNTILQQAASDDVRGRLQGVFTVVVAGGPRLGDFEGGVVASIFSPTVSVVSGGLLCLLGVVVIAAAVPRFATWRVGNPA